MRSRISLRRASWADLEMLLEWRNGPMTRQASHNIEEVTRDQHERWLEAILKNPNRQLCIAEEDGMPVGTVRADLDPSDGLPRAVMDRVSESAWARIGEGDGCVVGKSDSRLGQS